MKQKDFLNRIFLSLTGETENDWEFKIKEINFLELETFFKIKYEKQNQ
jgi:hypothetical protein